MCSITYHESTSCAHRWVKLQSACHTAPKETKRTNSPTKPGLNTCPVLIRTKHRVRTRNVTRYLIRQNAASGGDDSNDCPLCIKKGNYDRNECRLVIDDEYHLRCSWEPVDGEVGVTCVVM